MEDAKKTPEQVALDFQKNKETGKLTAPVKKADPEPASDSSPEKKAVEHAAVEKPEAKQEPIKDQAVKKEDSKDKVVDPKLEAKQLAQKRIDDLIGRIKDLESSRYKDREMIRSLEAKVNDSSKIEESTDHFEELASKRNKTYLEEDKSKPRAQRREMAREDLEDWLVEDMVAAQEWIVDQKLRRKEESEKDKAEARKKASVESLVKSQKASQERVLAKHPDVDTSKRTLELKNQGKDSSEIAEIISKENPKIATILSVLKDNPDLARRISSSPNGPEMLMDEVEKRMDSKKSKNDESDLIADALEEGAEAERQRQASADASIQSTREPKSSSSSKDEMYNARLKIFQKLGKSKADLDKALLRRQKVGVE